MTAALDIHPASADYLGPALVTAAAAHQVEVRLPDGRVFQARPAMAFAHQPGVGDEVLVIGNADGHYVIGAFVGAGKTTLSIPGDVAIHAVGGSLELRADEGVRVEAPSLEMHARKLAVVADRVLERFNQATQQVREMLHVHAGSKHTIVDGPLYERAKDATIVTEDRVCINGKEIHLG